MKTGDVVADFELPDETGTKRRLSEFLAKGPVVLFFYPAAMTMGCTRESCHFRDLKAEFEGVGAQRLGISADTVEKQKQFSDTHSFDYPLLSDTDRTVANAVRGQAGPERPPQQARHLRHRHRQQGHGRHHQRSEHGQARRPRPRGAAGPDPVTRADPGRRRCQPMWSAGMVPSLPCWKSSSAWAISARVFMTKGP